MKIYQAVQKLLVEDTQRASHFWIIEVTFNGIIAIQNFIHQSVQKVHLPKKVKRSMATTTPLPF
jgi:uncharacterized protein YegJ (DUF2314 family)